jgi:hypothetical protein
MKLRQQSANTSLSGPSSGTPAISTYRALAVADIPSLPTSQITSGVFPIGRGGTGYNSTLPGGLVYQDGSVPGGNTIANTVSETNFTSSYTMPPNSLKVGSVIRLAATGVFSTALVAPTLALEVNIGNTTVITAPTLTLTAALSNAAWNASMLAIVTAIGSSGSFEVQGSLTTSTSAVVAVPSLVPNTSPFTIDTTGNQTITLSAQWGALSLSNSVTLRQLTIEILNVPA